MYASDRDLLVFEPRLFEEVAFASQTLLKAGDAEIGADGVTLTAPGADLAALGVDAGWVVLIDGVAAEVIERTGSQTLTVSRVRSSSAEAPLPLTPGTGLALRIATFRPQIGAVHEQVLAALGVGAGGLEASGVLNGGALRRVEAFGALHLIFSGAAALVGSDALLWQKAQMYLSRYGAERVRAAALVDTDGDGVADATRRLNVMHLVRR